jgi:prepilin-type N-terminal cleavage/methylation domain-containing protein
MAMKGFSLLELMIVTAVIALVAASLGGVASVLHRTDRVTAAYVEDLAQLRRAVRAVERDVRASREVVYHRVDDVFYRLDNGRLLRDDQVVARHIGLFEMKREDDLVTVRVGLLPRAHVPAMRRPVVTTRVRLRNPEGRR